MTVKERALLVTKRLDEFYTTELTCYLNHDSAWQLLFATILSAQCTDARVNIVTEKLFKKYRTLEDFSKADIKELEEDIRSTGFYHNKAKNIKACATELLERYNGEVPRDIESLTALSGVGRKTANVVASIVYDKPVIAVDTHVSRVSRRLGLSDGKTPEAIGKELEANIDEDKRAIAHHWLILQGRYVCTARKPHCEEYNRNLRKNELKI